MRNEIIPSSSLALTSKAAERIRALIAQEAGARALRLSVLGGGCSGFQYAFELAHTFSEEDILFSEHEATLVVDQTSLPFVLGATLDFEDTLMGSQFKIENPNATSGCGCGISFAV